MKTKRKKKNAHLAAAGLHLVAIFEGAKGLLVLLTGFGVLALVHKDVHEIATQVIQQFHINPAHHYPRIFLDLTGKMTDAKLWALALGAGMYAAVRIIEAVGLWMHRRWAEWFGVLSGGMYIPIEAYELYSGITWPRVLVLLVNISIVWVLLIMLKKNSSKSS